MAETTPLPDCDRLGIERLRPLVGVEHGVGEVARALHNFARACRPPRVGAMLVTCADGSEQECSDAFRHDVTERLLPSLKARHRAPFRLATLGARYEWGAVAIGEQHFAVPPEIAPFKLMLIKLNAHVGYLKGPRGPEFGWMTRYGKPSAACGALHAVLEGSRLPVADEIAETLRSEGYDRLSLLRDDRGIDPRHRALHAALCQARLQARRALIDLQDAKPASPTVFAVVPSVTLNRDGPDGEIVCGAYLADWRGDRPRIAWSGLGDDPAGYRLEGGGRLRVTDEGVQEVRAARDHRPHLLALLRSLSHRPGSPGIPPEGGTRGAGMRGDAQAQASERARAELAGAARRARSESDGCPVALLRLALEAAARLDPVAAGVVLFAEGVAGIHHVFRVHRLARGIEADGEALDLLEDIGQRIDALPPRRARELVGTLAAQYHAG